MTTRSSTRSIPLAAALVTSLLSGCAMIQPPPVPSVPRFGFGTGLGDATCAPYISQAHAALAAAGAAAGDPAATAAAHSASASAMHAYHVCLAGAGRP